MRIAVIPGDGIGQEVVPAVLPALAVLNERFCLELEWDVFDWGAEKWIAEGVGLPADAVERLSREYDAALFGAVGDPRVPDMVHGREILLGLRRGLDLCVNHRPIVLPGHTIDLYRENTQGLYVDVGGALRRGVAADVAIDTCVYTRATVERFLRFCLRDLSRRGRHEVTLVHKANAVPNTGKLWQEVFRQELAGFPELVGSEEYVDSFCYSLVRDPVAYEGIVTSNLFGDIISDVGAALMGGLGLAASASICPETGFGLFEPVHGSAPDIAGRGIANPYAAAMSLVLMLGHFDRPEAARALRSCLDSKAGTVAATPDLRGGGTTASFMADVIDALERAASPHRDRELAG